MNSDLSELTFRFGNWWYFAFLLLPLIMLWWRERRGGAQFAGFALLAQHVRPSRGPWLYRMLIVAGMTCLIFALARPQLGRSVIEREQAGRDLQLVIDLSGSMQVDDLQNEKGERIDRLAAVCMAAKQFIANRANDRIGLVFFGDRALTSCPLTYDHQTVIQFIERTESQQRALWENGNESGLLGNATNLGLGIGTALRGLKDPKSKGRAIILITDGADSRELPTWVDPLEAARHVRSSNVHLYGIGVGNPNGTRTARDGFGRVMPVRLPPHLQPDMNRLNAIVAQADGKAFRANDREGLLNVFQKIDELEPTPRSVRTREDYTDRFLLLLIIGTSCIGLALTCEPRLRGVA
jgi:Ca-activated chloride channel homolog